MLKSTRQYISDAGLPLRRACPLLVRMVFFVVFFSVSIQSPVFAAQPRIAVVLSEEGGAYREFFSRLDSHLSKTHTLNSFAVGEPIRNSDIVVAVGMKASAAVATSPLPVLSVFVPRAGYAGLAHVHSQKHAAIYMDQPLERQLDLTLLALPGTTEIGVLYATPPAELGLLKKLVSGRHIGLHEGVVDQPQSLAATLVELLKRSEVLLVLPDMRVYNTETIRNILLETYRRQVPMIGISQSYVRAGALCAVYSTPQQFAQQAARTIEQFSASGKWPGSQYPAEFEVAVNPQVARSLGLSIQDAEQLRASMMGKP